MQRDSQSEHLVKVQIVPESSDSNLLVRTEIVLDFEDVCKPKTMNMFFINDDNLIEVIFCFLSMLCIRLGFEIL